MGTLVGKLRKAMGIATEVELVLLRRAKRHPQGMVVAETAQESSELLTSNMFNGQKWAAFGKLIGFINKNGRAALAELEAPHA